MAINSVIEKVDICQIVFDSLSLTMPDKSDEFITALSEIDDQISYEQHERLWAACMVVIDFAQESAFRLGWELRGQV